MTMNDLPVVSSFARNAEQPNRSTKYAGEFYDLLSEANQVNRTINAYRESGQTGRARDLARDNQDLLRARGAMSGVQRQAGELRDRMEQVRRNDALAPAEKRQRLDNMQRMLNQVMKRAVESNRESGVR